MMTNQLLRRYVSGRSESAFAELVRQHIDLVYSAALRQVGGDTAAAEDVTQAVFTDLARKAPGLTRHSSLTGWLYTSTRYRAAHARRAEQCRRIHEREAHEMNQLLQSADPDPRWQELRPLLDDAMHDLSATDREAVLLRYFERLPLAEIGARLGLKENAARMKVDRAIDRLRAGLAKRGVTSTITALAGVLNARAIGTAPAGLAARASSSAVATAAATGGLTWGLLKLAGLMKGNALLATGAAVLVAGFIVVPKWWPSGTTATAPASAASAREKTAALTPTTPGQAIANYSARVAAARTSDKITLHVVADDTGKPVAGATIEYIVREIGRRGTPLVPTPMTATDQGVCEIPVSRDTVGMLLIQSRTDGFVDTSAEWMQDRGESIPQQYTLRLARSAPISGQVVDELGKPVAGAQVQVEVHTFSEEQTIAAQSSENPHLSFLYLEKSLADADGRWRIDRFAGESVSKLLIWPAHPDYFTEPVIWYSQRGNPEAETQLVAGTYILKLTSGIPVRGVVLDTDGHPVPGVNVSAVAEIEHPSREKLSLVPGQSVNIMRVDRIETTNQADGTFVLTGCRPGTNAISAEARGFALAALKVTLANNPDSLRFVLNRGHVLRLRVLDANGAPAPNCGVSPTSLDLGRDVKPIRPPSPGPTPGRGLGSAIPPLLLQPGPHFHADAEGRVVWESSPDSELRLDIVAYGHEPTNIAVPADGVEHLVTLASTTPPPHLTVTGSVRDAATRQPIARFRMVTGNFTSDRGATIVGWETSQSFQGGTFQHTEQRTSRPSVRYKFEADGYAPFVTRDFRLDEGDVQLDIALSPAPSTSVTVLSRDGQPANVDIGFEMSGNPLRPTPGGLTQYFHGGYTNVFKTDDRGRFVLPPDDSIKRIIAAGLDGYADAAPAELAASPAMHLQPWGRIEGTYLSNGKPAAGRKMSIYSVTTSETTFLCSDFLVETDASGHFLFPRVPSGQVCLMHAEMLNLGGNRRAFNQIEIPTTVRLGETTTVSLQCCTVTAHLRWPAGVNRDTNWEVHMWASRPASTEKFAPNFTFKEGDDGTWMIEDVPPGNYSVNAIIFLPGPVGAPGPVGTRGPVGTPVKPFLRAETTLVIPQDAPGGAKDAGELMLQPVP